MLIQAKEAIIGLEEQNKPNIEKTTTSGVVTSTLWYILKNKECTGQTSWKMTEDN